MRESCTRYHQRLRNGVGLSHDKIEPWEQCKKKNGMAYQYFRSRLLPFVIKIHFFLSINSPINLSLDIGSSVRFAVYSGGSRGAPPFSFRPNWSLKGRKRIFWDRHPPSPPPYLSVWMTAPLTPLSEGSEGLDPPLVYSEISLLDRW